MWPKCNNKTLEQVSQTPNYWTLFWVFLEWMWECHSIHETQNLILYNISGKSHIAIHTSICYNIDIQYITMYCNISSRYIVIYRFVIYLDISIYWYIAACDFSNILDKKISRCDMRKIWYIGNISSSTIQILRATDLVRGLLLLA